MCEWGGISTSLMVLLKFLLGFLPTTTPSAALCFGSGIEQTSHPLTQRILQIFGWGGPLSGTEETGSAMRGGWLVLFLCLGSWWVPAAGKMWGVPQGYRYSQSSLAATKRFQVMAEPMSPAEMGGEGVQSNSVAAGALFSLFPVTSSSCLPTRSHLSGTTRYLSLCLPFLIDLPPPPFSLANPGTSKAADPFGRQEHHAGDEWGGHGQHLGDATHRAVHEQ